MNPEYFIVRKVLDGSLSPWKVIDLQQDHVFLSFTNEAAIARAEGKE